MLTLLALINSLVTVELSFLSLIIWAIKSSKTINTLRFIPGLYFSVFLYLPYHLSIQLKL